MDKSFEETSSSLFERFNRTLAKVDLRHAVAVPAFAGAVLAMSGIGVEVHGQMHLLQTGGAAALDAYQQATQGLQAHSITEFVQQGFAGQRPTFGGNTEARGFAMMGVGPMLSSASVLLARGFEKVRGLIGDLTDQFNTAEKNPQFQAHQAQYQAHVEPEWHQEQQEDGAGYGMQPSAPRG
jgi:hypothetical protein